jgi:hypothetical protein
MFELAWRGVAYGAVDALVLFVFPAAVAYLVLHGDRGGVRRRLAFGALTLVLSLGITATYHLGYAQFRGSELAKPEIGAVFGTVPAALTGNPAGSLVLHDSFHVAASVHTYRSGTFLPPDLDGYAERGSGTAGLVLAAGWMLVAGIGLWSQRHRLFPKPPRQEALMS